MESIFASAMNEALVSIGSNHNKAENLSKCRDFLNATFNLIRHSNTSITTPYGKIYKSNFMNQLVIIKTSLTKEEVNELFKSFEKEQGRSTSDKENGIVIIDVDIVTWNGEVLRPSEMERSYIKDLLHTLSLNI